MFIFSSSIQCSSTSVFNFSSYCYLNRTVPFVSCNPRFVNFLSLSNFGKMMRPNNPIRQNEPYQFVPFFSFHVVLSHKIFFQQKLALTFGVHRWAKINASPQPFVLPLLDYLTFDIYIFVLI